MPWNELDTLITGQLVTAAMWEEARENMLFLEEVAYQEFTSDVPIDGTTVGAADQIVSAGAVVYEAVPHLIEFWCPQYTSPASASRFILRDGTTVLGTLALGLASVNSPSPYFFRRLTPTAGSHTYNIAAWVASGTGTVEAGSGGTAGDASSFLPGFIRVTRIPT